MLTVLSLGVNLFVFALIHACGIFCPQTWIVCLSIFIVSASYFIDLQKSEHLKPYSIPLGLAYLWRLILLFFDIYGRDIYGLPGSGADTEAFYHISLRVMNGGKPGLVKSFTTITGTFFSWFGSSRLLLQYCLMLCSIITLHWIIKSLKIINISNHSIWMTMLIVGLLPNFAILSVALLRESITTACITISLYMILLWINVKPKYQYIVGAFIFAVLASLFHGACGVIVVGYLLVFIFYDSKNDVFHFALKKTVPAVFFIVVFLFLYNNYGDVLFGKISGIKDISSIATGESNGGSSYAQYVGDSSNIFRMIIYTIPRLVYYMFSPFPWQWRGLSDIIAFAFSSCFYAFAIYKTVKSLRKLKNTNVIVLCIIAMVTWFLFAWGLSNTGTAIRHRDKFIAVYAILMGICIDCNNT